MHRRILLAFVIGLVLFAFAALPPMLPGATMVSLVGSALAQKPPTTNATNLNSSRSNIYRDGMTTPPKKTGKTKQTGKGKGGAAEQKHADPLWGLDVTVPKSKK